MKNAPLSGRLFQDPSHLQQSISCGLTILGSSKRTTELAYPGGDFVESDYASENTSALKRVCLPTVAAYRAPCDHLS